MSNTWAWFAAATEAAAEEGDAEAERMPGVFCDVSKWDVWIRSFEIAASKSGTFLDGCVHVPRGDVPHVPARNRETTRRLL